MADKVRVAILGTGNVANGHAEAHLRNRDLIEVVALADVVPGKAAEFAARHGLAGAKLCDGFEEAVALPDVDAVDVCLQWEGHGPAALAAIAAGKHVLCEKPMASSVDEARQMLDAAEAKGVVHMIDFCYRFYPAARFMKQLIDEGRLGEIIRVRTEYLYDTSQYRARPGGRAPRKPDLDRPAGNILGNIASHIIDLARFYGGEITSLNGQFRVIGEHGQMASALVDFASGATGSIEANSNATGRTTHYRRAEVHGTKGGVTFYYSRPGIVDLYLADGVSRYTPGGFSTVPVPGVAYTEDDREGWVSGITGASRAFATAIREGTRPEASFRDGYTSMQIMDAIARSSRAGEAVSL